MIRVTPAPEPEYFDARVRQQGLRALAELVGEVPDQKRRGRPRKIVAVRREDLKSYQFPPIWTEALDSLCEAYHRICAYTGLYIERVTGSPTVDHMVPKTRDWKLAYEWSNYRLACALMNARKGEYTDVLDPFEVGDDWFGLEFVAYQVVVRDGLDAGNRRRVQATIERLQLRDEECCKARGAYVEAYLSGEMPLGRLEQRAPFIARELRRQGRLREDDI